MRRILAIALFGSAVVFGGLLSSAQADEYVAKSKRSHVVAATPTPYCRDVERCGPAGCVVRRICTRPCPDGYSCFPLYGAYGPYGGAAYWGAYTMTGWGYRY